MVGFCAIGMAYLPFADAKLPIVGRLTNFQALLLFTVLLGAGTLLRDAGSPERSITRTMSRIVVAYLLFELLVVIPVALWLGAAKATQVVGTMSVRVAWMLFPVVNSICRDEWTRRLAGAVAVIAAALVVAWGLYAAATGGGGYYFEFGELRYRILPGIATLLIAWPFVLAMSGAVPRRYAAAFLVLAAAGMVLVNHRSAIIAFALAGSVCLVMSGQIRRVLPAAVPIALVAVIVAIVWGRQVSSVFSYTVPHLFDLGSANAVDRITRWRLAWDFFVSRPFNDYVWSWRYYLVRLSEEYQPHNFPLEVAGREGVVGLAFYGSILWTALRGAWSWVRRDAVVRSLIGWLVVYFVFSLVNANHYLPSNMPLLVAVLAALATRADRLDQHSGRGHARDGATETDT